MVLLAAFQILLRRHTGHQDVLVGSLNANRNRLELEGLIGFFVNTLVLRTDFSGNPTFCELLARVRATTLDAYDHQDLPFEKLVEVLQPERTPTHAPLCQVVFAYEDAPPAPVELPELSLAITDEENSMAKVDLTVMIEWREGLRVSFVYNTDLFEAATMRQALGHYRRLLEAIVEDPARPVDRLPMLMEEERRRLLVEWNQTQKDYPQKCIHELFEEQVERTPDAVAVVHEERELSYGELNARANQLAHYLRELGVKPDGRVAICVERGLEMVVGLLAVLKAGGAYVPLDPAYPADRLNYMLEDSTPAVLLTQGRLRGIFEELSLSLPMLDLDSPAPGWREQPESDPSRTNIGLTPAHLAYVIYTSGSTGVPKGVMVEHRSLTNYLVWVDKTYYHQMGSGSPMIHSIGFDGVITTLFGPIIAGQTLTLLPRGREMDVLGQAGSSDAVPYTLIKLTPSHLKLLNRVISRDGKAPTRTLMIGGEAPVPSDVMFWQRRFPEVKLVNHFGPTETTVGCCTFDISVPVAELRSIPIGRPIANTRVYILDTHQEPVPVGVAGELYIGGAGVARGYLNRSELTAERFLKDPFVAEAGARMYRTGDLGKWLPDGTIAFLGRSDSQVKIRGFRVELEEIETALAEHAGVHEVVVVAREDTAGNKRLVAYYTCAEIADENEGMPTAGTLRSHLAQKLPEYMVPAAYVRLESLPLTPNGKLDRNALPAPKANAYANRGYEEPVGEIERTLAEIWADVLEIDRVGRHDNFFELGGHSLLAVTLIERMWRAGLRVDVRALFAAPTLSALSAVVGPQEKVVEVPPNLIPSRCEAITPEMLPLVHLTTEEIDRIVGAVPGGAANVQDICPLAPMQEGILFHHLISEASDPYQLAVLYSFKSRALMEAYLEALQAVIDRHDILRTGVMWEGLSDPVQVVWRKAVVPVEEVVLEPAAGDAARQLNARFNPRMYRINLCQAPLLRVFVVQDTENERWLLLMMRHHLTGDHRTLQVIQQEIQAHLLGQADRLPAPLPFRNLVAQARREVSPGEHEAFFRRMLGDVDEPTAPFGLLNVQGDGSGIEEAR